MVRHIVTWDFKEEITLEEMPEIILKIKSRLESLRGIIGGIAEIKVRTDLLPSSNRKIALVSLFESIETLAEYQTHPEHKKISAYVGSVMCNRVCIDYEE